MALVNVTWDAINKSSTTTLSNNNLTEISSTTAGGVRSTLGKKEGKWYCEITSPSAGWFTIGAISDVVNLATTNSSLVKSTNVRGYTPNIRKKSPEYTAYGNSSLANEVYSILLDLDNGILEFWKNGVSQGVSHTDLSSLTMPIYIFAGNSEGFGGQPVTANFGATSFAYPIPEGYKPYANISVNKILLLQQNGEINSADSSTKTITKIPSHSEQNLVKYGMDSPVQVDGIFSSKNYILSQNDSKNTEGLLATQINRKPLSIKFD